MPTLYLPVALTPGMWGVDTTYKLTLQPGLLDKLCAVDLHDYCPAAPKATPIDFFGRYVPLPGNEPGWDIDGTERAEIAARKRLLLLFQHVRGGSWTASAAQGAADAVFGTNYAKAHGYAPVPGYPPPAVIKDMESVGNPGPDAVACMQQYIIAARAAGFQPPGYEGFDSGLTTAQWAAMGVPVMSDYGARTPPPGRGFAIKQHPQVKIFGIEFDVDEVLPDLTGDLIYGMGAVDVEIADDPGDPHVDPSGAAAP